MTKNLLVKNDKRFEFPFAFLIVFYIKVLVGVWTS